MRCNLRVKWITGIFNVVMNLLVLAALCLRDGRESALRQFDAAHDNGDIW